MEPSNGWLSTPTKGQDLRPQMARLMQNYFWLTTMKSHPQYLTTMKPHPQYLKKNFFNQL